MNDRPWIAHYDKGVPATIDYPKEPLFHFLEESARKDPDRACTIFKGAVISFREMNDLTDHIARKYEGNFYAAVIYSIGQLSKPDEDVKQQGIQEGNFFIHPDTTKGVR